MRSMIEDLQEPSRLPDPTADVRLVQTHISLVFVADRFVYKIKKPVDFGFLDFTTLEKRRFYCQREVELNRRLSHDLYLGVLPVIFDGRHYSLCPVEGEVREHAVKMRRLPEDRLMKTLFEQRALTASHLEAVAAVLARFHARAERTAEIDRYGKLESFRVNTDENFEQVRKYINATIRESDFRELQGWTRDFYAAHGPWFRQRIEQGRIRDCHGDLHMEHICFGEQIAVFDCIEFNERFRYSDTLADIAFLLMDLEYHGGREQAAVLWDAYRELAGERGGEGLLTFYKVYRAFVRGKVNSFQLDDPGIGPAERQQAVERAGRYFRLAREYIEPV